MTVEGPEPVEPREEDLPAKPPIEKMPHEDGLRPPLDDEVNEPRNEDLMDPDEADADDTIDNQEQPTTEGGAS